MKSTMNGNTKLIAGAVGLLTLAVTVGIGWGALQGKQEENTRRITGIETKLDRTYSLVVLIAAKQGIDTSHAP